MAANVVDELIVRLRLDSSQYKKADAEVDRLTTATERKARTRDKDRDKRMKESTAAVKQFGGALRGLALTIGSVLGLGGGAAGLVGAVVSLTNFETNLRRATVSTGLSNREMQAWGSAARRLGADAQAGAQAIAELAREQKQFNLTGTGPTMQAFARLGINITPNTPIQDVLAQAQQRFRESTPAQRGQIEAGLAAQGVSNDLILLIKSEKNVREEFSRSFAEAAEENRKAMDSVSDAMEAVKNSAINVANTLAAILQPNIEQFAQWVSQTTSNLSGFNDRVIAAGGGVEGFMKVLDAESPQLAETLRALGTGMTKLGETVDVVIYGFQSIGRALSQLYTRIDEKFGLLTGTGSGRLKGAVSTVGDAISWAWGNLVNEARREGGAPVGSITGSAGGVRLTPGAAARVAAGELGGPRVPAAPARSAGKSARPSAQDVMQYLVANGMTVQQAAAVAASIQRESGFDPTAINREGGGQGARGLAQWRGARINAFRARFGMTPDQATWQQQLDFLTADPYERHLLNKSLSGPGGAAELGTRFSKIFEGHGKAQEDARRGVLAQQLAQQYNPVTGTASGLQIAINGPVTVQANNPQELVGGLQRQSGVGNYNSAVR